MVLINQEHSFNVINNFHIIVMITLTTSEPYEDNYLPKTWYLFII